MQTLTLEQLRTTANTGGIVSVAVKAKGKTFLVQIFMLKGDALLAKARSTKPRYFTNPFQAITLLRKLGITNGTYDVSEYTPEEKASTHTRPDRTEALKRTHQAAAYDQWFRAQVQDALAEADDPTTTWISHDAVKDEIAQQRQSIQARALRPKNLGA